MFERIDKNADGKSEYSNSLIPYTHYHSNADAVSYAEFKAAVQAEPVLAEAVFGPIRNFKSQRFATDASGKVIGTTK
jgi:hypothetical protein